MFVVFLNSDLILVQINDIIASMMVLPNRQVFPLVSDLHLGHLRWSNPQVSMRLVKIRCIWYLFDQGVIRVIIIQGNDLLNCDLSFFGERKSDPYVKVKGMKVFC